MLNNYNVPMKGLLPRRSEVELTLML